MKRKEKKQTNKHSYKLKIMNPRNVKIQFIERKKLLGGDTIFEIKK